MGFKNMIAILIAFAVSANASNEGIVAEPCPSAQVCSDVQKKGNDNYGSMGEIKAKHGDQIKTIQHKQKSKTDIGGGETQYDLKARWLHEETASFTDKLILTNDKENFGDKPKSRRRLLSGDTLCYSGGTCF